MINISVEKTNVKVCQLYCEVITGFACEQIAIGTIVWKVTPMRCDDNAHAPDWLDKTTVSTIMNDGRHYMSALNPLQSTFTEFVSSLELL